MTPSPSPTTRRPTYSKPPAPVICKSTGRALDDSDLRVEKDAVHCQLAVTLDEKLAFTGAVDLGAGEKSLPVLTFRDQEDKGIPLIDLLSKLLPSDIPAPPIELRSSKHC